MVAYLMDLLTGEQLEVESMLNPQRPHGADVISRTDYTIDRPEGLKQMSELVCSAIESMTRTIDVYKRQVRACCSATLKGESNS